MKKFRKYQIIYLQSWLYLLVQYHHGERISASYILLMHYNPKTYQMPEKFEYLYVKDQHRPATKEEQKMFKDCLARDHGLGVSMRKGIYSLNK